MMDSVRAEMGQALNLDLSDRRAQPFCTSPPLAAFCRACILYLWLWGRGYRGKLLSALLAKGDSPKQHLHPHLQCD